MNDIQRAVLTLMQSVRRDLDICKEELIEARQHLESLDVRRKELSTMFTGCKMVAHGLLDRDGCSIEEQEEIRSIIDRWSADEIPF